MHLEAAAEEAAQTTVLVERAERSVVMMLTIHIYEGLTNAPEQAAAQEAETLEEAQANTRRKPIRQKVID